MTEFDVSDDVEAVVEDTELPRRLKNEVYESIDGRDVPVEKADEIARAVESRYLETRVDPLDPVGTVSAQSIGIPADEEIVVRRDGETDIVEIGPFVDSLVESRESRITDDHEVALAPEGIEVPSLGSDEQVHWKTVEEVSRHETPDELLRFELESGRSIRATKAHSFVTRRENEVVPVAGEELDEGDWLPVVADLDN
jgi:DNA-directed RNA polymerase subunit A"